MNHGAEPPAKRWINQRRDGDDPPMTQVLNLLCGSVLIYASVTRGSLAVARGIELVYARTR